MYQYEHEHESIPTHPQAFGEDIEVPFISWLFFNVQFGTEVTAPPGAVIHTPKSPSELGTKIETNQKDCR